MVNIADYITLSGLKDRLGKAYKKYGSLTHPEVIGISRKLDKVILRIMQEEERNETTNF